MRYVIAIILLLAGTATCIKYKRLTEIIGYRIAWAERYLGSTYTAYFLFGLIAVILGFLILTGVIDLGIWGI